MITETNIKNNYNYPQLLKRVFFFFLFFLFSLSILNNLLNQEKIKESNPFLFNEEKKKEGQTHNFIYISILIFSTLIFLFFFNDNNKEKKKEDKTSLLAIIPINIFNFIALVFLSFYLFVKSVELSNQNNQMKKDSLKENKKIKNKSKKLSLANNNSIKNIRKDIKKNDIDNKKILLVDLKYKKMINIKKKKDFN